MSDGNINSGQTSSQASIGKLKIVVPMFIFHFQVREIFGPFEGLMAPLYYINWCEACVRHIEDYGLIPGYTPKAPAGLKQFKITTEIKLPTADILLYPLFVYGWDPDDDKKTPVLGPVEKNLEIRVIDVIQCQAMQGRLNAEYLMPAIEDDLDLTRFVDSTGMRAFMGSDYRGLTNISTLSLDRTYSLLDIDAKEKSPQWDYKTILLSWFNTKLELKFKFETLLSARSATMYQGVYPRVIAKLRHMLFPGAEIVTKYANFVDMTTINEEFRRRELIPWSLQTYHYVMDGSVPTGVTKPDVKP